MKLYDKELRKVFAVVVTNHSTSLDDALNLLDYIVDAEGTITKDGEAVAGYETTYLLGDDVIIDRDIDPYAADDVESAIKNWIADEEEMVINSSPYYNEYICEWGVDATDAESSCFLYLDENGNIQKGN